MSRITNCARSAVRVGRICVGRCRSSERATGLWRPQSSRLRRADARTRTLCAAASSGPIFPKTICATRGLPSHFALTLPFKSVNPENQGHPRAGLSDCWPNPPAVLLRKNYDDQTTLNMLKGDNALTQIVTRMCRLGDALYRNDTWRATNHLF